MYAFLNETSSLSNWKNIKKYNFHYKLYKKYVNMLFKTLIIYEYEYIYMCKYCYNFNLANMLTRLRLCLKFSTDKNKLKLKFKLPHNDTIQPPK